MNNKKGFTLIELLAVIVVLAIVTVIAASSILPYMSNARPDAFKVEATNVIKSAKNAIDLVNIGQVKVKSNSDSCRTTNGTNYCFTVKELINLGLYEDKSGSFIGKVLIDVTNSKSPKYELYLQKGAEFNITAGSEADYVNKGEIANGGWASDKVTEYTTCSCS